MNPITTNFAYNVAALQTYQVTTTGSYTLTVLGAQGGAGRGVQTGGLGASVAGDFTLQAGTQLLILSGGQGVGGGRSGGGGGGSFVFDDVDRSGTINAGDVLLLAAGGGVGGGFDSNGAGGTGTNADSGTGGGGSGGGAAFSNGGGGAGINGGGSNGNGIGSGTGAASIQSNGTGSSGGNGGYGGGGGGGFIGGGGGGGYSGGNGGSGAGGTNGSGQGGTSYFNTARGTQTVTSSGTNAGNGSVRILAPAAPAPCYVTGSRIRVLRGLTIQDVPVEDLAIGDVVVTASDRHRPIRWIGTRSYLGRFANTNPAALPVCVRAGALVGGVPARDLWVSPNHALFLDGLLVPAELLVNGASITKAERVESVTYWHIELDSHDVLLAEGAPAESFVDDGGRGIFHNAASYRAMYPDTPSWPVPAVYCAPRVADDGRHGHALEAIRRRLTLRAGLAVAAERVFGELGSLQESDVCVR